MQDSENFFKVANTGPMARATIDFDCGNRFAAWMLQKPMLLLLPCGPWREAFNHAGHEAHNCTVIVITSLTQAIAATPWALRHSRAAEGS
jgi:hypothetical protein